MRNLFALLWRNQFFVLFILLETTSIFLLTQSYSYHGSLAYSTTGDISGNIFNSYNNLTGYLSLAKENTGLIKENARLRNMVRPSSLLKDTGYIKNDTSYKYIPARVVQNTVNKSNNFMVVNKGNNDGILKEMGVISQSGAVGVVVGVSNNYATIMSLLHSKMRLSARIKKSGQLVNVVWGQKTYLFGTVIDIPSHISLEAGDSIITSGNSMIFPENILIGVIESHETDLNKNLSSAKIRLGSDFNSLYHVYIIDNTMDQERDSLIRITTQGYE
jgi:rod shape-determining protein MreC